MLCPLRNHALGLKARKREGAKARRRENTARADLQSACPVPRIRAESTLINSVGQQPPPLLHPPCERE